MARHRPSPRGVGAILALAAGLTFPGCGREPAGPQALPQVTIIVSPARLTLTVGASAPLAATVLDAQGETLTDRTISWASSSPAVAAVSSSGLVTANSVGVARISALIDHSVAFVRVDVQVNLRLPLVGGQHWLLRTEMGTATSQCSSGEGGIRYDGAWDCTHAGNSRYSLDFAAITQEEGALTGVRPVEVLAAADGLVISVCLRPPSEVACGPNGPSVTVEHPPGFLIIYAHLDPGSVTIRRKMAVTRGQLLGNMGVLPGDADGWVHFEFRTDLEGPDSGPDLETLVVDGLELPDYRVGPDGPRYYRSTNYPRSEIGDLIGFSHSPLICAPFRSHSSSRWLGGRAPHARSVPLARVSRWLEPCGQDNAGVCSPADPAVLLTDRARARAPRRSAVGHAGCRA